MQRSRRSKTVLMALAFSLALHAGNVQTVGAQSKEPAKTRARRVEKKKAPEPAATPITPGVAAVQKSTIETMPYLPGEIKVVVKGTDSPVVKLGMALSGISVIEFPETDRFFAIHPPENGDWIRVEKSPSMKGDHHLVLRAGPDLVKEKAPAASLAIQMESGLNVVLWIYPATSVIYQTHRCVFSYNRSDVVASRRAAGLAVNLGKGEEEVKTAAQVLPAAAEVTPLPSSTPKPGPTSATVKTTAHAPSTDVA